MSLIFSASRQCFWSRKVMHFRHVITKLRAETHSADCVSRHTYALIESKEVSGAIQDAAPPDKQHPKSGR